MPPTCSKNVLWPQTDKMAPTSNQHTKNHFQTEVKAKEELLRDSSHMCTEWHGWNVVFVCFLWEWNHLVFYVVLLGSWCVLPMFMLKQMKFMQYNQFSCFVFVLGYLVRIALPDRMQNTEVQTKHNTSDKHQKEEQVKNQSHAVWLCRCVSSVEPRSHCIYYFL